MSKPTASRTRPAPASPAACDTGTDPAEPSKARCPICRGQTEPKFRPFCSRRCADVDLSRWLKGAYAIPGRVETDEDGDDTAAAGGTARQAPQSDPDDDA